MLRFTFFGGKGGVGKTTCAAAAAVRAASEGASVLIVSTDPAHALSDVLGLELGAEPRAVRGIEGGGSLFALELDSDKALGVWLSAHAEAMRTIADRGTYLDEEDIDRFFSLAFPGVDPIVSLSELMRVARVHFRMHEASSSAIGGHVVVDTAPTGHTLRLLEMPGAMKRLGEVLDDMHEKHRYFASITEAGPQPELATEAIAEIAREAQELRAILSDERRSSFTWVTLAEDLPMRESEDGVAALEALGVRVDPIVINRMSPPPESPCASCTPRANDEASWRDRAHALFKRRRILEIPNEPREVIGVTALAELGASVVQSKRAVASRRARPPTRKTPALIEEAMTIQFQGAGRAAIPKSARLVFVGGKGGGGKTTVAAAMAMDLAEERPSQRVLVLSTDHAHSLGDVLDVDLSHEPRRVPHGPKNLVALEVDAAKLWEGERERYRQSIDDLFSSILSGKMDATFDRRILEDFLDLAPPGFDELVAFVTTLEGWIAKAELNKEERDAAKEVTDEQPSVTDDESFVVDDLSDWENIPITGDDVTVSIAVPEKPPPGRAQKKRRKRASAATSLIHRDPPPRSSAPFDLVVVDTAPTGHTRRLLALPERALAWAHELTRVIAKYRSVIGQSKHDAQSDLSVLTDRLRGLITLLSDPTQTAFVIVTRPTRLARLEAERLARDLRHLKVPVSAIVANAVTERTSCSRCAALAESEEPEIEKLEKLASRAARSPKLIIAPAIYPGPRGATQLSLWRTTWREGNR